MDEDTHTDDGDDRTKATRGGTSLESSAWSTDDGSADAGSHDPADCSNGGPENAAGDEGSTTSVDLQAYSGDGQPPADDAGPDAGAGAGADSSSDADASAGGDQHPAASGHDDRAGDGHRPAEKVEATDPADERSADATDHTGDPDRPDPITAEDIDIEETIDATARTAAQLRSMRDDARALEQQEDWQGALDRYREALEIDSALLFAKEGVARTAPRATLMATVSEILHAPERLVDAAALREARSVLRELEALEDSGPIYRQQREALRSTLETAATPIPVTLQSDGVTDVTIARVQRLGTFEQQVLSLRPGTYTAVGIRNGFRDVRVEFSVDPEGDMSPVDVRCVEAL